MSRKANFKLLKAKNRSLKHASQGSKKLELLHKKKGFSTPKEGKHLHLKKSAGFSTKKEPAKFVKSNRKRPRDSYEDEEESNNSSGDEPEGNVGWADSIAKVLSSNKPKTKKALVLSRAKKDTPGEKQDKKPRSYDFEIDGKEAESEEESTQAPKKKKDKLKERLKMIEMREIPLPTDPEEKELRKIATKAVVQFFNAVNIQQKKLEVEIKKAGPLDHKKDAVYTKIDKRTFLDILKNEKPSSDTKTTIKEEEIKEEESNEVNSKPSGWSVLRPDFMTNKKLTDWNNEDSANSDSDNINTDDDLE